MARNNAGKWVARAGATGGGRTYRGNAPVNWYAGLAVIIVLGVLSVVMAGISYRNGASAATTSGVPPLVKNTWYAGLAIDACGTQLPSLASNVSPTKSATQAFFTTGNGVITVAPKKPDQAGNNAVLGKFVSGYPGFKLSTTSVTVPSAKGSTTYTNGQVCKKGTPDAGKKANIHVAYWSSLFASSAKATAVKGDPNTLKFTQNQLITIGFVPDGTKLPKPSGTVVSAVLNASQGGSTTAPTGPTTATTAPTTAPTGPTTATTAPTTATTAPTTATTAPTTATTAPKS